jgi:2-succinyl-5-enolpyruvyl-6-hydroxy-3-cyclohexene-1-carboxylate synthase
VHHRPPETQHQVEEMVVNHQSSLLHKEIMLWLEQSKQELLISNKELEQNKLIHPKTQQIEIMTREAKSDSKTLNKDIKYA